MTDILDLNLQSFEERHGIWSLLDEFDRVAGSRMDATNRASSIHELITAPDTEPIAGIIANSLHAFDMLEMGIVAQALPVKLSPDRSERVLNFFSHPLVTAYRWNSSNILSDRLLLRSLDINEEENDDQEFVQDYFAFWRSIYPSSMKRMLYSF